MRTFPLLLLFVTALAGARAATIAELFPARLKSVVAVEFLVQTEIERRPVVVLGTVADANGTIILPGSAIAPQLAPAQLKDFKVYRPGTSEPFTAEYLGQDPFTGWHFLRVEEKARALLTPITAFPAAATEPALGEELWGIGLRNKDEDFAPYLQLGNVGMITRLPQKTAILTADVAGPGLPVFNARGEFAGLALNSFGQNFLLFSRAQNGVPILLVNVDESSIALLAEEVLPNLGRIPHAISGRPVAWLGAYGLQPMDPAVAKFLHLEHQSGVVVSDIMEGSPAALAGLKERDIILAVDGRPFPHLKPDRVLVVYLGQQVLRRRPGDVLALTVRRGTEQLEVKVTLGEEPKMVREADRQYFERLGLTVREFLYNDSIAHRIKPADGRGVVVHFVKPNSPAATAGLRPDDWVREIDGVEMKTYADATKKLAAIEADKSRAEFVMLVSRGGETSVLRVKLN
ncbi:MAG: PDZ domain-containing protein [Opitutae bacterium]|nr:PDZ domain-containing protein [Opitutae bacterium]